MFNHVLKPFIINALLIIVLFAFPNQAFANDYDDAIAALKKNNLVEARNLLIKATNNPATALEATMLLVILEGHIERNANTDKYVEKAYSAKSPNFYPYMYGLWFNGSMLGNYGKKTPDKLKFINQILKDEQLNGSLRAATNYQLVLHHVLSGEFENAPKNGKEVSNINKWQLVGPFDNLLGSGFDKEYAPIYQTKGEFLSSKNAKINWFTPSHIQKDGWLHLDSYIPESSSILYMQSFVNAPEDMDVILGAGVCGNVKIWINDRLVMSESEERVTELDTYKVNCKLKKGYNRLVIQLGHLYSKPNVCIRFIDKRYNSLDKISYTDEVKPYTSEKNIPANISTIPLFAETYFLEKIKNNPNDLLSVIMLSEVYMRNKKLLETRRLLQPYVEKEPNHYLLRYYLITVLSKSDNRTDFNKEISSFKEDFPESLLTMQLKFNDLIKEENYTEAQKLLDKTTQKFGKNEEDEFDQLKLYAFQKQNNELIAKINECYKKHPEYTTFVELYHNIQKEIVKDPRKVAAVYEKYLETNYNSSITRALLEDYKSAGMADKGVKILEKLHKNFPEEDIYVRELGSYYYSQKNYKETLVYYQKRLGLNPFSSYIWRDLGTIYEEMKETDKSLDAYKKALSYRLADYSTRRKIRMMENKPDLLGQLPEIPVLDNIKKSKIDDKVGNYNWYYILDEKQKIVYPEGASEEYHIIAVKIVNQEGVDYWHQTSLPYNSYRQRIIVGKSEVVKKNGTKIEAESDDNSLVFTGLEIGDAIYIRYKTESYQTGRMSKDFWDEFIFGASVPTEQARYSLIVPSDKKFDYKILNGKLEPTIKDLGDYKQYVWEVNNMAAVKIESYMPPMTEVSLSLSISSVKSWNDITSWYSDISTPQAKDEFEVEQAYQKIFEGKKNLSNNDKLRIIYEFVVKNIQYSSVSFRQSGFVPQTAAKTLQTKLGDCKDVSTLYATLARKAGFKVNLCLVNTRSQSKNDVVFPSTNFNHCIVKANVDNKEYYLELTNPYLSFASLPTSVENAQILEIPYQNVENLEAKTINLKSKNIPKAKMKNIINAKIENRDWKFEVKATRYGKEAEPARAKYGNLSVEKQKETLQKRLAGAFKNPLTVDDVGYPTDLNVSLSDSISYQMKYSVKNEILEIGSLKTFIIPYYGEIININEFQDNKRTQDIILWEYQDAPEHEDVVIIKTPVGTKLIDIPTNTTVVGKFGTFIFTFQKVNENTLKATRIAKVAVNEVITPEEYAEFKKFLDKLTDIENKYVTFK